MSKKIWKFLYFIIFLFLISSFDFAESNIIYYTDEICIPESPTQQYIREQIEKNPVGSIIVFGAYEQNGIEEDGKEKVEWILLKKNEDNAILISKYIIDCYRFDGFMRPATWENCSLRTFMNTEMLLNMFSEEELDCILPTYLSNSINIFNGEYSGNPTIDYLFIPGIDEMVEYFSNDNFVNEAKFHELLRPNSKRMCVGTNYAINRGLRVTDSKKKHPFTANYLLRTTGLSGHRIWYDDVYADYYQSFVSESGEIKPNGTGINSVDDGIRPMVQVKY